MSLSLVGSSDETGTAGRCREKYAHVKQRTRPSERCLKGTKARKQKPAIEHQQGTMFPFWRRVTTSTTSYLSVVGSIDYQGNEQARGPEGPGGSRGDIRAN